MCLQLLRTKLCFFKRQFRFRQSTTNRYRSIPVYLSTGIDNRYQSITTRIFAMDWSSIININRLIDIDWYRLSSIMDSIGWIPRDYLKTKILWRDVLPSMNVADLLKHQQAKILIVSYIIRSSFVWEKNWSRVTIKYWLSLVCERKA